MRVLLREREDQQQHQLADVRLDLADHPHVEEIDLVVPPAQVSRVRVRVVEPVDEHLLVVRLEQLPRRLLACLPCGASLRRTPPTSSITRRRAVEYSSYTFGTASRG